MIISALNITFLNDQTKFSNTSIEIQSASAQDNSGENQCNDCQYRVKYGTCTRYIIKYDSNGKQISACMANGTKITCPSGTGSCTPDCNASC